MVQQLIRSQQRKNYLFLTKFLLHITRLGAAFVVTWYEVCQYRIVCFFIFETAFLDVAYISRSVQVALKM